MGPPPAGRENGRKRRRRADGEDDDDYDDEDFVVEEEDCAGELSASSAGEEGEDSDAEYQEDDEEEEEEETPRAKRPVKGGARGGKGRTDPASNSKRGKRHRYEVDDDYEEEPSEDEEPDEDEEVEEYRDETPRQMKVGTWGRKGKKDPAPARPQRHRYEVDDDYEYEVEPDEGEEPDEDEEVEEYQEEVEEYKEEEEEYKEDEEEYKEEVEEEEEAPPSPKSTSKCADRGHSVEEEEAPPPPMPPSRSHRRKYEEDDTDFEPELDDDEEEVDEDIDFDPEVDDEGEDEFEDEEEEEFGAARSRKVTVKNPAKRKSVSEDEFEDEEEEEFGSARSRKVTVKNPAKRKSVSKRRSVKKKANKGSKSFKRKRGSAKAKKSASVRRVRKRFVVDDQDSEDDDDFIVDDEVEVSRRRRKKARTGTSKQTELEHPSFDEEGIWPNVESETSEFEFVTSDDEPDDAGTAVVEASSVRKGRKKRKSGSESSSDSEFVVSDKELENLGETPPKLPLVLAAPLRKNPFIRQGEDKGKEKEVPEEAGNPICGICLSEEQRTTVQGMLNCCSHYFCFACIMEWSRVESRCPLCKQRFTTITKSSKADLGLALRKAIIKVEERDQVYQPTEEEIRRWLDPYENVVCIECNQGGDDSLMLLCDICDSSAHTYCVGLGREVPEGNWYCGGCRLSDEGPSHAITPSHTVGYQRQSYRNHVDYSPVGFGVAAQNGTFDRSSSMNRRRSFQGIDLNLSPREGPGEHHAESHASTDSVSTPSGRHATVSGRRQIHRYIRILLSRPRTANTRLEDILPSFAPHNGGVTRTELNHHSFRSSSEANTSQIPDGIQNQHNGLPFAPSMHLQNQHNGLPFAPSMPLDGDDFTHIEGVKSNLRNV